MITEEEQKYIDSVYELMDDLESTNELAKSYCKNNTVKLRDLISIKELRTERWNGYIEYDKNIPSEIQDLIRKEIKNLNP